MKQIIGYEDYQIDEYGNVFNKLGKQLKPWINSGHKKYWRVSLSKGGKSKKFLIHRLVAQHYLEDWDENLQVDHINGSLNNHYTNLQMVSCKKNNELASQRDWERGGNQRLGISGRQVRRYRSKTSRKFVGGGEVQRLSDMEYAASAVEAHNTPQG